MLWVFGTVRIGEEDYLNRGGVSLSAVGIWNCKNWVRGLFESRGE